MTTAKRDAAFYKFDEECGGAECGCEHTATKYWDAGWTAAISHKESTSNALQLAKIKCLMRQARYTQAEEFLDALVNTALQSPPQAPGAGVDDEYEALEQEHHDLQDDWEKQHARIQQLKAALAVANEALEDIRTDLGFSLSMDGDPYQKQSYAAAEQALTTIAALGQKEADNG